MSPHDFVWISIYRGAKNSGATELASKNAAQMGLDDYKKGKIDKKVSDLIFKYIKLAKRVK